MGTFYNGITVHLKGVVPAGSQVLAVVRGADRDEFFNRKGRVGPIWVNADKLKISGIPSLFLSFSSADINTILDRETIDRYVLDEVAIKKHIRCVAESGPPDDKYLELIHSGLLALKEEEGTYRISPGTVQVANVSEGSTHYALEIPWPRRAPPESYQVEVYACRGRKVIGQAEVPLSLVKAGFPAWMAILAHDRPWLYGILAVVTATIAGFGVNSLVGLLRRPKKARIKVPLRAPAPGTQNSKDATRAGEGEAVVPEEHSRGHHA